MLVTSLQVCSNIGKGIFVLPKYREGHPYCPYAYLHLWFSLFWVLGQCVLKLISAALGVLLLRLIKRFVVLLCSGLRAKDLSLAATLKYNKYVNIETIGGCNRLVFLLSCLSHWFGPRTFPLKCVHALDYLVFCMFKGVHHYFRPHSLFSVAFFLLKHLLACCHEQCEGANCISSNLVNDNVVMAFSYYWIDFQHCHFSLHNCHLLKSFACILLDKLAWFNMCMW